MVIYDFHFMRTFVPFKAYAPLFINADAVLPFPVAGYGGLDCEEAELPR